MARGSKSAPAQEQEEEEDSSSKQSLSFSLSLTTKGLSSSELLKRFKSLHLELSDLDQDLILTSSLDTVASSLLSPHLLLHKDKGVRAYCSACLVDILRLYAPEAPYNERELKDLFQFVFKQLSYLSTPSDPHFKEYFYTLQSLSDVKSLVLICDLEASEELIAECYKTCFDLVSSSTPKNVSLLLADILSQVLDEASVVPAGLVDALLAQFLGKSKLAGRELATSVASQGCDKLQRYVSQYFLDVLSSSSGSGVGGENSEDEDDEEEEEEDDKEGGGIDSTIPIDILKAHQLIIQLHRAVPELLLNVVPQLESELTSTKPAYRKLATITLGRMVSTSDSSSITSLGGKEKSGEKEKEKRGSNGINGGGGSHGSTGKGLATLYPSTWKEWIRRVKDKEWKVRIEVVKALASIWSDCPELKTDVEWVIKQSLLDPDDKVRLAAVTVFEELDYETCSTHVSKKSLKALAERCKDKKEGVRKIAFKTLGKLYDLAFSEIESSDPHSLSHFSWIPSSLLTCLVIPDASIRSLLDATFVSHILPLPTFTSSTTTGKNKEKEKEKEREGEGEEEEEVVWTDRWLIVLRDLGRVEEGEEVMEEGEKKKLVDGLWSLTRLSERKPGMVEAFVNACEKNNGGVIDTDSEKVKNFLKMTIKQIAASGRFPDAQKASDDLTKFAKANEKQLYKLLRTLVDPTSDVKTLVKAYKESLRRLEQISTTILDTFQTLIRLTSYLHLNRSSIPTLLKRASTPSPAGTTEVAKKTLRFIAKVRAGLFKSHVGELVKLLGGGKGKEVEEEVAQVVLHAICRLLKSDESVTVDKKLSERAKYFAEKGISAKQSKYAATVLAYDTSRPGASDDLVEYLANALIEASDEDLVIHLAALNRFARYAQDSFENKSADITKACLEVLSRGSVPGEVLDESLNWVEDAQMDPLTHARLLSIKVLTSRALAYAETDEADTVAAPVFSLLWPFLVAYEEESKYSPSVASRLRLTAALSLLKLATFEPFQVEINKRFDLLARTAQDPCFEVRSAFVTKLMSFLRQEKLKSAPRFNMILFLVAHDPEDDIRNEVAGFVRLRRLRLSVQARTAAWEHPFVRLVHLLARHPDFQGDDHDASELDIMSKYINMYIDNVVNQDNVPYVYHLALKLKTVRDSESDEYDHNLYLLSELSQHLLKTHAQSRGWAIPTQPESPKMPGDIFRPLGPEESNKNIKRIYLSTELLNQLASATKGTKQTGKRKTTTKPKVPKEPKAAKPKAPKKKSTTKKRDDSSDEDEDNDEIDSDGSEDEVIRPAEKKPRLPPKDRSGVSPKAKTAEPEKKKASSSKKKVEDEDEENAEEEEVEVIKSSEKPKSGRGGRGKKEKEVAMEVDSDAEEEDEELVPVSKKSSPEGKSKPTSTPKDPPKSKPDSKSKSKPDSKSKSKASPSTKKGATTSKKDEVKKGKVNGKAKKEEKPLTRGIVRGLGKPRAMELKNLGELESDLKDDDDEEEMEVDS